MFVKIENWLSLGNQYTAASVIYLGITLMLGCSFLGIADIAATENSACSYTVDVADENGTVTPVTYDGCPEGQQCCGGECISADMLCCEDGTSGDSGTCSCCGTNGEISSISCQEP